MHLLTCLTGEVALVMHSTFSYILIGVSWPGPDEQALHLTTPRQPTPSLLDLFFHLIKLKPKKKFHGVTL
jgi:hypothetical protein